MPNVIYHALYEDETAAICNYFVPAAHPLESWGDGRSSDGVVTIVQPLIDPLWGGKTEADVLAGFLDEGHLGTHALLQRYWNSLSKLPSTAGGSFDAVWERWLADGVVPDTGAGTESGLTVNASTLAQAAGPLLAREGTARGNGLEIAFALDPKVHDGRFANNAWLQELPQPVTKVTWDNAVLLSQATADRLGIDTGDWLTVSYKERTVDGPAMIVPGHADDAITLPLGYGRERVGHVGNGVGFNANAIRTSDAPWFDRGASVAVTGSKYKFAITQDHWTMSPDGRDIPPPAASTPLSELLNPGAPIHEELEERRGEQPYAYKLNDYSKEQYKWGMADRPQQVHGLQRLRGRLPVGEQHLRSSARRTSPRGVRCSGCASTATSPAASRIPRSSTSRLAASTASWRPASTSAPSTPPSTATRA